MTQSRSLAARVAALKSMDKAALQNYWVEVFGVKAPHLHIRILRQRLIWRIQELELGGLSDKAKMQLEQLKQQAGKHGRIKNSRIVRPPAGTRIQREYDGECHEVLVLKEGFEYRGQVYRSLSKIARLITGSHWSGPLFFNLRGQ